MRSRLHQGRRQFRSIIHASVEALESRRLLVGVTLQGSFPGGTQGGDNFSKYLVTETALTVPQAQAVAGKVGETLVTINGAAENSFVSAFRPGSMWIGLEVRHHPFPTPYDLLWDSGQPVSYTSWGTPGEPNNTNFNESRVAINEHRAGGWNDLVPSRTFPAVVEIELGTVRFGQLTTYRNQGVVFSSGVAENARPIVVRALDYDLNVVDENVVFATGGVWECEFEAPASAVWLAAQYENVAGTSDISLIGTPPPPPPAQDNRNQSYHRTVNIASGSVNRIATDFSIPARGSPIELVRSYNSSFSSDVGMGQGWAFSWSDRISVLSNGSLTWTNGQGQVYQFLTDGSGGYVTPESLRGQMLRVGTVDGPGYWFTDNHGYRTLFGPTSTSGSYRLLSSMDRYGNGQTITHLGSTQQISAVQDTADASRSVVFAYDAAEHLTEVTDFSGRRWSYTYTTQSYLDGFERVLLSSASGPLAASTEYSYNSANTTIAHTADLTGGLLRELRDAEGGRTTYGYHLDGRNAFVRDGQGNTTVISGNPLTRNTIVRDPRGRSTTFIYGSQGELLEVQRDGSTDRYTWGQGQLKSHIDPFGRTESYAYDLRGNVTLFTDLNTRRTTKTYDPLYNQVLTSTDANGHTTSYQYDVAGNNTMVLDPGGNRSLRTYDSHGQLITSEDARGNSSSFTYNIAGQLLSETRPLQTTRTFDYDVRGNLTLAVDAEGRRKTRAYDELSRLTQTTDALGKLTSYTYDTLSNVLSVKDRLGRTTSFSYDALHRLTRTTLPDGTATQSAYDSTGNLTRSVDPIGRTITYDYDSRGHRTKTTDALLGTNLTVYDLAGRVTRTVDALQRSTTFTYDSVGRLLSTTDALGNTTSRAYDAVGNLTSVTDARQRVTRFQYDNRNLQTLATDPLGRSTTTAYDVNGNITLVTDALGHRTSFSYDALDRPTLEEDALGHSSTIQYDRVGNRTRYIDTLGRTTSFSYDALDRITRSATPLGEATLTAYDAEANVTRATDPLGRSTSYAYDALSRQTRVIDGLGKVTSFAYDSAGNRTLVTDRLFRRTTFGYDSLNRLTLEIDALNHRTTTGYDAVGNVTTKTDPLGHRTRFEYDAANRLTRSFDANNEATTRSYDAVGNLTLLTDPEGNRTTFQHDALNRVTQDTNTLLKSQRYEYDAVGNLTAQIDRNSRRRSFVYDALNRRTHELWIDGAATVRDIAASYDAAGQLLLVSDPDGTNRFGYDLDGRMASADNNGTTGVPRVRFSYVYDAAGNRTRRDQRIGNSSAISGSLSNSFDAENRLRKVVQAGDGLAKLQAEFGYDAEAQLTSVARTMLSTGRSVVKSSLDYFADGRLRTLVHRGSGVVESYVYAYDAAGRMVEKGSLDGPTSYSYDAADQLTGADYSAQTDEDFSYDGTGNRTNAGYITLADNRLQADGRFTYQYDDQGNLVRRTESATGLVTQYVWDHRNRLTTVQSVDGTGLVTQSVTYTYDPLDRRIRKTVVTDNPLLWRGTDEIPFVGPVPFSRTSSPFVGPVLPPSARPTVTDVFVYDGDEVALQFNSAGSLTHAYLGGPGLDQPLADQSVNGPKRWVLTDHQGSVTDLVNTSNGVVDNRVTYTGFGSIASQTNSAVSTLFGFTGQQQDPETGFSYLRARYYDPATGRFVSQDPTGFAAGDVNLFRYASNNPVTRFDRTGRDDEELYADQSLGDGYQSLPPSDDQVQSLVDDAPEQVQTLIAPEEDTLVPTGTNNGTDSDGSSGSGEVSESSDDFDGGWKDESLESKPQLNSQDRAEVVDSSVSHLSDTELLEGSVFSDESLQQLADFESGRVEVPLIDPIDLILLPGLVSGIRGAAALFAGRSTITTAATDAVSTSASKALRPYYPPNRGFLGQPEQTVIARGTVIDRFGSEAGTFASPAGTSVRARALPPGTSRQLTAYEVVSPISVKSGRVAAYFGQPGGGIQYELPASVRELIDAGVLRRLNK